MFLQSQIFTLFREKKIQIRFFLTSPVYVFLSWIHNNNKTVYVADLFFKVSDSE